MLEARLVGVLGIALLYSADLIAEVPVDLSKLPPSANKQVDFARDIKPIFDASCIRCHGPAKPRSGFRLDNRNSALKGGDNGVDIMPGNGAKSPLVHFTAHLVADMEMPPAGKGQALTAAQIGLLRAWIDQGAVWEMVAPAKSETMALSGLFGGTTVSGHHQKFRELYWQREGPYGGLTDFQLRRHDDPDTTLTLSGHVLPDDYKADLSLDRTDLGFIHSGVEQYRKYFNDVGGFDPISVPTAPSLNEDLYLNIGKAWVDFGLTLPHWPRMVLGYEYDFRRGNEASTSWGAAGTGANERNLAPTSENINEGTHIIKFDLDAEVKGVAIEDRFRGEFYSLNTHYTNAASRGFVSQNVSEGDQSFQGANTIRVERQFKDWFFVSAGYLYSKLNSEASFTNVTMSFGTFLSEVPQITLDKESHVVNLNGLVGQLDGMTFSTGVQGEWTTQHGFGVGNLNQIAFTRGAPSTLAIEPSTLLANYDEKSATETVAARYTKIPFTALFLDARLEQDSIGENENDLQSSGNFVENAGYSSELKDIRFGFSTSPWQRVSLTADYRRYENDSAYPANAPPQPAGGYPDYFRSRELITDEVEAKLVLRPCNWFRTTLSCQYLSTDYRDDANPAYNAITQTIYSPGGDTLTGSYESQIYTISAILTPHSRVYIDASFSYEPSKTSNADSANPALPPYKGDTCSADVSGTYVVSESTDLTVSGIFSDADYGQPAAIATVPVDLRYQEYGLQAGLTRHFNKNFSGGLQYGFNYYHEPSSGDANDFRAHTVFATLNFRLP